MEETFKTVLKTFFKPFPKRQNLDSSKLKEFADNNSNLMKIIESSPKG